MDARRKSIEATDSIRNHVAKRLSVALTSRCDLEPDFDALGKEIEAQLFLLFNGQVQERYKSKFRTLIFNIEDDKNVWLFRYILLGTIAPETLVRMTTEQLANEELKKWRTLEDEKNMERIWSDELEKLKIGMKFVYKTAKGEEVNEIVRPEE